MRVTVLIRIRLYWSLLPVVSAKARQRSDQSPHQAREKQSRNFQIVDTKSDYAELSQATKVTHQNTCTRKDKGKRKKKIQADITLTHQLKNAIPLFITHT